METLSSVKISFIFFCLVIVGMFACTLAVIEKMNMMTQCAEVTEYDMLGYITERFAEQRNYTDDYDCVNYSEDYERLMAQLGIEVTTRTGCNDTMCHRWVQVGIDPQTGQLSHNARKYPQER